MTSRRRVRLRRYEATPRDENSLFTSGHDEEEEEQREEARGQRHAELRHSPSEAMTSSSAAPVFAAKSTTSETYDATQSPLRLPPTPTPTPTPTPITTITTTTQPRQRRRLAGGRLFVASFFTCFSAAANFLFVPAVVRAKAPEQPVDLHTPASSFNLPVPPSADFQLAEFDLPGGGGPGTHSKEQRKLTTRPHRSRRKKMNSFVREAAEQVGPCVVRIDVDFGAGNERGWGTGGDGGGGGGGGNIHSHLDLSLIHI